MKQYRLSVILHQPSAETEDKYLAEVPALPGCRAWGDTPGEAWENVQSVAREFILSYQAHGDPLPDAVERTAYEPAGPRLNAEATIYV